MPLTEMCVVISTTTITTIQATKNPNNILIVWKLLYSPIMVAHQNYYHIKTAVFGEKETISIFVH